MIEQAEEGHNEEETKALPVLPLRDVVVYPHMVIPLFVGRKKSIKALEAAMEGDKEVLLVAQKAAAHDDPGIDELYHVGTVSSILQMLRLPDGTVKVLVEGESRGDIISLYDNEDGYWSATLEYREPLALEANAEEALARSLIAQFEQYVKLSKKIPPEILTSLNGIQGTERLTDTIAAHMSLKIEDKQALLEIPDLHERVEKLMAMMEGEIQLLQVESNIRHRVKEQIQQNQREHYLSEQMKAIQKELGNQDAFSDEDLAEKIKEAGMPEDVEKKALSELGKLKVMPPMSAEATVSRNYLDWLVSLPWEKGKSSKIRKDLGKAEKILEEDHYGLEEVKERIIEYLAVQQRVKKLKGPILCLVGPPGVGKTSLGRSIARATGREFIRVSLGGVRDEAEIRGHRRTYIGALPGKIIQKMSKAGVRNPLFLLDEIDKMASDFRGDPASALLEVLDPEQNNTFNDHYLEVDYDLSDVMFVCTSNSLNIPEPLLDRMETIRISGYTEDEKVNIIKRHLFDKQFEAHGLKEGELEISDEAIHDIIRYYTREAGVRSLERALAKISRKVVRELSDRKAVKKKKASSDEIVLDKSAEQASDSLPIIVNSKNLEDYLGVRRYRYGIAEEKDQIGQVCGLAWTEVGGELLTIEAVNMPGKGEATYTGQLGDVMQESIQAAMTVVRARSASLGIKKSFYKKNDFHVHVPEGATPKDGPSAGIGMCTALVSALTKIPVRADVAMTGEITLRGDVLPIGGLKEKLLAARRGGLRRVIIPEENVRDLKEIPDNIKKDLDIRPVRWIDEVLDLALSHMPEPLPEGVEDDEPSEDDSDASGLVTDKNRRSRKGRRTH